VRISSEEEKKKDLRRARRSGIHLLQWVHLLYMDPLFNYGGEGGSGAQHQKKGEETEKRFLPIQVRTASFFLLNEKGRDLF
jgi:hypothetical protein